jgi:hypothetical protein
MKVVIYFSNCEIILWEMSYKSDPYNELNVFILFMFVDICSYSAVFFALPTNLTSTSILREFNNNDWSKF